MATNYNPTNVSIAIGGKPVEPLSFFSAPIKPVTAPVYVNGALLRGDLRVIIRRPTPRSERTTHPMRFHRP